MNDNDHAENFECISASGDAYTIPISDIMWLRPQGSHTLLRTCKPLFRDRTDDEGIIKGDFTTHRKSLSEHDKNFFLNQSPQTGSPGIYLINLARIVAIQERKKKIKPIFNRKSFSLLKNVKEAFKALIRPNTLNIWFDDNSTKIIFGSIQEIESFIYDNFIHPDHHLLKIAEERDGHIEHILANRKFIDPDWTNMGSHGCIITIACNNQEKHVLISPRSTSTLRLMTDHNPDVWQPPSTEPA